MSLTGSIVVTAESDSMGVSFRSMEGMPAGRPLPGRQANAGESTPPRPQALPFYLRNLGHPKPGALARNDEAHASPRS